MNTHKNASLTPKGRAHLVTQIATSGLAAIVRAAGVSIHTARKWRRHFLKYGKSGLFDRSSRPHHSPRQANANKIERAVALRRKQRLTYARIAERVSLSVSTVPRARRALLADINDVRERVFQLTCPREVGTLEAATLDFVVTRIC